MRIDDTPGWLNTSELTTPVARLLGGEVSSVDDWECHRLKGGLGESLGVWKLTGHATLSGETRPWALVLKGWETTAFSIEQTSWKWPYREVRAYTSGLLEEIPGGIRAPRCLGTVVRPGESEWVWLELISDDADRRWTLDHFAIAARKLGEFNGSYLGSRPLPEAPWLSCQWTRQKVESAALGLGKFEHMTAHPLVARAFPPVVVNAIRRMWDGSPAGLDTLNALPQTFCHLDAFRRNVFFSGIVPASMDAYVIDWAFSGIAAVGEEISPLVLASLFFSEYPAEQVEILSSTVFESYVNGLQSAGWSGDPELVRTGYMASIAMRYGVGSSPVLIPVLMNENTFSSLEEDFGKTKIEIVDNIAGAFEWIAETGDKFLRLMARGPQFSVRVE